MTKVQLSWELFLNWWEMEEVMAWQKVLEELSKLFGYQSQSRTPFPLCPSSRAGETSCITSSPATTMSALVLT